MLPICADNRFDHRIRLQSFRLRLFDRLRDGCIVGHRGRLLRRSRILPPSTRPVQGRGSDRRTVGPSPTVTTPTVRNITLAIEQRLYEDTHTIVCNKKFRLL